MPKLDQDKIPTLTGTTYPSEYNAPCQTRHLKPLGDAGGLTQFGAHLVTLPPGCWASQRHAHSAEDEFIYILSGHPTLIDNFGETPLAPGDACTHKAGDDNPHHLVNQTDGDVTCLVIGTRNPSKDNVDYPDADMMIRANGKPMRVLTRKDGKTSF